MGVHQLVSWIQVHHGLATAAVAGTLALLAVFALLKLVGLIRRLMWSLGLLIAAGTVGGGDGLNRLHALTQLR
jgi:hypothetical protein